MNEMTVEFRDYPLAELEDGLTVRHPTQSYPVWLPALGMRLGLLGKVSVEDLSDQLTEALAPFWDWFSHEFRWRTGRKAGRWVGTNSRDARLQIATVPPGEWGQTFSGGDEKLQAHPVKCRIGSWLHRGDEFIGDLTLTVPIAWFLANEGAFLRWVDDLCEHLPIQGGWLGLCGVGSREFPSKWNACEFFILQHYLGIDACDEARLGPSTPMHEGYLHGPQWLTLLGPQARERMGGSAAIELAAMALGLSTSHRGDVLKIRASQSLDPGFERLPTGLAAMSELLKPNRGKQFFIGHSFEMYGSDALGETGESASTLWANRFDRDTEQMVRWPGRILAARSIELETTIPGNVVIQGDGCTPAR